MRQVFLVGVGMTRFGKHVERSMKSLAAEAFQAALADAGLTADAVDAAFVGNAVQGVMTGQECVRGQVVLREAGIGGIPVVNVENACASGSTAVHLAWQVVAGGFHDCALALGMEKLYHPDRGRTVAALGGAVDVDLLAALREMLAGKARSGNGGEKRSPFMELYALAARDHMARYGTRVEHFAAIACARRSVTARPRPSSSPTTISTVSSATAPAPAPSASRRRSSAAGATAPVTRPESSPRSPGRPTRRPASVPRTSTWRRSTTPPRRRS
jgi:acetyl-CoA acetyltransferase